MIAYKYDEKTKEFIGEQQAQLNPIEGDYLLPANCTFIAPPQYLEGYVACFQHDGWVLVTDQRGTWQVKLDDITFSKVNYIGNCKPGYQFITEEEYNKYQNDNDSFAVINNQWIDITDTQEYKDLKEQKEKDRISNLQCTKRVFVLMLQELGIDYFDQILPVIEANKQARLEWDLCVQLQRKNPLLDQIAAQFGVTSEQLDILFKVANNENDVEDLRATIKEDE